MADPFVAEIRILPTNFAPRGWAFCNGQLLPLSQNTALFSLLGTTYGGNGQSTFALPDLQGNVPMHPGQGPGLSLRDLGESSGTTSVTLLVSEIPAHAHTLSGANTPADSPTPGGAVPARVSGATPYRAVAGATLAAMAPNALAPAGASLPHNNLMPYLVLNFCIALQGVFPPRA
jgi:microcystin-dependent protein